MLIGELAEQTGLTTKTIRFYEGLGIVAPQSRHANGYREYSSGAVERLRFVKSAQAAGLTLAEVGEILDIKAEGRSSCSHTRGLLHRHLAELDEQLARLAAARAELASLAARAEALDPAECTDPDKCQVIALDLPVEGKVYGGSMSTDNTITITVEGMTCEGCAGKVRTALTSTPGVKGADIDVPSGRVDVHLDGSVAAEDAAFAVDEAVFAAGYRVA